MYPTYLSRKIDVATQWFTLSRVEMVSSIDSNDHIWMRRGQYSAAHGNLAMLHTQPCQYP